MQHHTAARIVGLLHLPARSSLPRVVPLQNLLALHLLHLLFHQARLRSQTPPFLTPSSQPRASYLDHLILHRTSLTFRLLLDRT